MELLVSSKLSQPKFHGIPWNCWCHRNWQTPSSMEFQGTARVSGIGARQVPRNSMEVHGIPWNRSCQRNWHILSSKEFHGTAHVSEIGTPQVPWNSMELLVSAKLAHFKFQGIPWNCSCQRNWHTPSSMEFHETACVIEIGALLIP